MLETVPSTLLRMISSSGLFLPMKRKASKKLVSSTCWITRSFTNKPARLNRPMMNTAEIAPQNANTSRSDQPILCVLERSIITGNITTVAIPPIKPLKNRAVAMARVRSEGEGLMAALMLQ